MSLDNFESLPAEKMAQVYSHLGQMESWQRPHEAPKDAKREPWQGPPPDYCKIRAVTFCFDGAADELWVEILLPESPDYDEGWTLLRRAAVGGSWINSSRIHGLYHSYLYLAAYDTEQEEDEGEYFRVKVSAGSIGRRASTVKSLPSE